MAPIYEDFSPKICFCHNTQRDRHTEAITETYATKTQATQTHTHARAHAHSHAHPPAALSPAVVAKASEACRMMYQWVKIMVEMGSVSAMPP